MKKILLFALGLLSSSLFLVISFSYFPHKFLKQTTIAEIKEVRKVDAVETNNSAVEKVFPPLNIDQIFTIHHFADIDQESISLIVTGDIIPARVTDDRIRKHGVDYPFRNISSYLQGADITVSNLESPLIDNCPRNLEGMKFCGVSDFSNAMSRAGIDVVGLENNHIGNYGQKGILETETNLTKVNIEYATFSKPAFRKIKGINFGFLAANFVGNRTDKNSLSEAIIAMKTKCDVCVVMPHWGREYTALPESAPGIAPDDPIEIGHFMIDSGADLILGNHPHNVQGVEKYKEGFISYAHGNFIFDQEWSNETKEGVIGQYIFWKKKLIDVSFKPIIIEDYSSPRIATDSEAIKILGVMKKSSNLLNQ